MIACDTTVLSQFLRRSNEKHDDVADNVRTLIETNAAALFGIVRQEVLSGIKHRKQFERIELITRALPLFIATDEDHVMAARFYNACRAKGIQGSSGDFLICAMAVRHSLPIYTTDPDFEMYAPVIPIELYRASGP